MFLQQFLSLPYFHFAKLIYMNSGQMQSLYPKLVKFQAVRQRMDPDNLFYTERLKALFG